MPLLKLFQATNRNKVSDSILQIINEIANVCDSEDDYLLNAKFALNTKLALVWGGFADEKGESLDHCFEERFRARRQGEFVEITDLLKNEYKTLPYVNLKIPQYNLVRWWNKQCNRKDNTYSVDLSDVWDQLENSQYLSLEDAEYELEYSNYSYETDNSDLNPMRVKSFGQQVKSGTYSALQRNASNIRDVSRPVPTTLVVVAKVNGHPVRALIDSVH